MQIKYVPKKALRNEPMLNSIDGVPEHFSCEWVPVIVVADVSNEREMQIKDEALLLAVSIAEDAWNSGSTTVNQKEAAELIGYAIRKRMTCSQ